VLALLSELASKLEELASIPSPNKMIRFVYTLFDELFARTVDQEDEIVFVIRSITLQLQSLISPNSVTLVLPLLRHLVRFSSIPKLRSLYNHMYDVRDFYCTEFLGRGQFAEVLKGYNKHSGQSVALKKMKFSTVSKGLQAALLREAAVMSKMANSSVVRLYDSFQEDVYLYLVMEYSPLGDMEGYMEKKQGKFELFEISHILRELSNGLRFLRSQSIVHRDLKPANILLFNKNPSSPDSREIPVRIGDLALKLTDFTMARRLDDGELAKTVCGSPLYMAPEVLNRRQYTDKADLWSVGVILYRLIFNTMPFNGLNEIDLRDNLNHKPVPIPENDPRLTPVLQDLLSGLLQKDPFLRIDWEEFFIHPFLRPPRLGSTMMTDESLDLSKSSIFLDATNSSGLTSISAQDAIELQRQIRDYESRLQHAQRQVHQLIGDLEQSKLRELLKEQQLQRAVPIPIPIPSSTATSEVPTPSPSGPIIVSPGAAPGQGFVSHQAPLPSPSSTSPQNANPRTGTIRFSDPSAPPPNYHSPASHHPSGHSSSSLMHESQVQTPNNITELAISTLSQKLQSLAGLSASSMSSSSMTTPTAGPNSVTHLPKSAESTGERDIDHPLASAPTHSNGSSISNGSGSGKATHQSQGSESSPEEVAAQSNIQMLLSQIHPDRAVAIDIVQHLLAEVLVSSDEEMDRNLKGSQLLGDQAKADGPRDTTGAEYMKRKDQEARSPKEYGPLKVSPRAASSAPSSSSNPAPLHPPVASSSNSSQPLSSHEQAKKVSRGPNGMSAAEREAWELEKATLLAEGEQWRQLFSQVSNDNELLVSQLNEAKTMLAVLEDDLKDKSGRLATASRLEQEYTRSTIFLEDQLKSSRERVTYLEAEFQALDTYRSQMKRN
jgi:serine/threonine protein kinase